MNTLILIIRNKIDKNHIDIVKYFESIEKYFDKSLVFIVNCAQEDLSFIKSQNIRVVETTYLDSDSNIFAVILQVLNSISKLDNKYVIISDVNNVFFERNSFSYLEHFKNDLYLCNFGSIQAEPIHTKNRFSNFIKTCSYFLGNENAGLSIGGQFFGGTYDAIKSLSLILFLETNRNSAQIIDIQSILSYIYSYLETLYKVKFLDQTFFSVKSNFLQFSNSTKKPYIYLKK